MGLNSSSPKTFDKFYHLLTYINISYLNWKRFDNIKVIQIKKIIPKKISLHLKGFHSSSPIVFQK